MKRSHRFAVGITAALGIAVSAAAYAHPEQAGGGTGPAATGGMGHRMAANKAQGHMAGKGHRMSEGKADGAGHGMHGAHGAAPRSGDAARTPGEGPHRH